MIQIIKEINVEVTKPNIFQALVAKQYDMNTRFLKVTLMDCGDRIDVPATETTRVVINAERKDGQSKGFDGEINEDGTVTVPLHSWMLELDGTVNCDISVIDTATDDNKKLTTTTFTLLVEKAAYGGDGITSDPQYDVLIQLINDCNEVYQNFLEANDRVDSLETDVETIKQGYVSLEYIKNNYPDAETVDRRIAEYVDLKTENIPYMEQRITYVESDIIDLQEDIVIIREDFATKQYVDDAVASNGGGVSSWNDLTDKPFYDEGTKTATLDYANPPAVGIDLMGDVLYKVTDDILTEADINSANISLSGTIGGIDTNFSQESNVDTAAAAYPFTFGTVYQFNYEVNGTTVAVTIGAVTQTGAFEEFGMSFNIPETGTYIAYSFLSGEGTINSISLERDGELKTLDIKFIPNDLYTEIDQRIENYINEALGGEY